MEPARTTLYRSFLLATIPALALLGFLLGATALLVLAAAWTGLLGAAWIGSRRALRGLSAGRRLYPSAFEGDLVDVEVALEGARRVRMVEVSDAFGPGLADEQRMLEPGPLERGFRQRLGYRGYCSRHWGLYRVGPLELVTSDPAGLFHAWRRLPLFDEFAVFPRVYDVAGLRRIGARPTLAPQEWSAGRPGRSLAYLGVRDYRPGDDLRHIHWPATARRGAPVVKEYEVDLLPYLSVFVDLDRRHRAGTGKKSTVEYVLRTAASLLWTAVRDGDAVQVFGEGRRTLFVPPGRGETHLTFALYELIRAAQDGTVPIEEAVRGRLPSVPENSSVAIVSATIFLDLGAMGAILDAFRGRGVRAVAVLVNDHSFPAFDKWPRPRVEVVERTREVAFFLRSHGVPSLVLEEADDLEAALGRADFTS